MRCPPCHGTGKIGPNPVPCDDCGGTGIVHCCEGERPNPPAVPQHPLVAHIASRDCWCKPRVVASYRDAK